MASLSETGSWKSSGRVLGRKGILSTNTALGGPDGCVSKRLRLALGRSLRWLPPADDGGGFRLFWRRFLAAPLASRRPPRADLVLLQGNAPEGAPRRRSAAQPRAGPPRRALLRPRR